ncbi:hypothetical protein [Altererythrobacter lutimaris]|uniref:Uncharacterized protein n=1 Tax=Altererythrobacter lutimaris TaxID=2743979 RepID=A0A850HDK6_9SPHN|nr:hypothetical protein [Altererythrobacter lutimaris]NVE94828.1 hypothetical protein [Altererythrobacter lutimaris]
MNEASFASLNPTLLARKGGAKPAMRPQLAPIPDATPKNLEDLGWNDMGDDAAEDGAETAEVVHLKPTAGKVAITQDNSPGPIELGPIEKPVRKRQSALKQGKRAAFTLRLDQDRHLKLRLAATMQETSAQELVTKALDALLGEMTELETLAAQMKKN